jgi:hypothetical protein
MRPGKSVSVRKPVVRRDGLEDVLRLWQRLVGLSRLSARMAAFHVLREPI